MDKEVYVGVRAYAVLGKGLRSFLYVYPLEGYGLQHMSDQMHRGP